MSPDEEDNGRRDRFAFDREEAIFKILQIFAFAVFIMFGSVGVALALWHGGAMGNSAAAYSAGLTCIVIAGQMVIAIGALHGHRTMVRAVRSARADGVELLRQIDSKEEHTSRAIGQALGDQLRHRRDERG